MIIYDQRAEAVANKAAGKAVEALPISQALYLLVETERRSGLNTCHSRGESARGESWGCRRLKGHLPPHAVPGMNRMLLVWTDE